jgi:DNA-binding winged helix-turn-helix (wHTH) protein
MENLPPSQLRRFGAFEVNFRTGELLKDRRKIKLQEQPFQILVTLLERPGELVTREELRLKIWPGDTFVDFDHSLNTAVKKLRQALSDNAERPVLSRPSPGGAIDSLHQWLRLLT